MTWRERKRAHCVGGQAPRKPAGEYPRADTLTEQAYRLIEEQIVTLRLKPGDVLSEQMLSATFDIGRTRSARRCSGSLARGLSRSYPARAFWCQISMQRSQLLVLEVRREIERLLSRAGAERATKEQRAKLQEIAQGIDRAAKTNNDLEFMRLDRELTG